MDTWPVHVRVLYNVLHLLCILEGPPSGRFEVTVKLNETFDDKLPTNNSDERRNFILQFEKEVWVVLF